MQKWWLKFGLSPRFLGEMAKCRDGAQKAQMILEYILVPENMSVQGMMGAWHETQENPTGQIRVNEW